MAKANEKTIRVWTAAYRPFICGGDVNAPIATTVTAAGPHDLGRGFKGFLVRSPKGKTFVAEAKSGAFIGPSIASVRKDIAQGELKMMKKQVADAVVKSKTARQMSPEEFWTMFR